VPGSERPTRLAALPSGTVEYRLDQHGGPVVLVLHGGHTRAGLTLGEEVFTGAGFSILAPSRPGYGRTPVSPGGSLDRFADLVRDLCGHLGADRVAAVVGISGGGRAAATLAARHPYLVERLILLTAVGFLPYPDRRTRLGSYVVFGPGAERATWAGLHAFARRWPEAFLRLMMRGLSTLPPGEVVAALSPEDRATLVALFARMRSGRGFREDLRPAPDVTPRIGQPTLVIATRHDGGVPFAHAQALAAGIRHAELVESRAASHFVTLGPDWPAIEARICTFLATPAAPDRPR
jgi:pimeloyl-ACP methyl ester carboxylesterase